MQHLFEQTQLFNQEMAVSWSVEEVQTFLSLIAEERLQKHKGPQQPEWFKQKIVEVVRPNGRNLWR